MDMWMPLMLMVLLLLLSRRSVMSPPESNQEGLAEICLLSVLHVEYGLHVKV